MDEIEKLLVQLEAQIRLVRSSRENGSQPNARHHARVILTDAERLFAKLDVV